jgi:hypothetical protein
VNRFQLTRLADLRRHVTARQARAAWWRSQPVAGKTPMAVPSVRLHWVDPLPTRMAGA